MKLLKQYPEKDVDRTSAEGKASSVQFIHFKLNDHQVRNFKLENISGSINNSINELYTLP